MTRCPSHPGELLKDIIPNTGKTITEIAKLLRVSREHLHSILRGDTSVSPAFAAKLGKLFGDGALIWLKQQAAYDAWQAENNLNVDDIPTIEINGETHSQI